MKIIVLTSKNHIYANYLLSLLLKAGVFNGDQLLIYEQAGIVPGKTKLKGLWRYLRRAGVGYVFCQAAKQYLFIWRRWVAKKGSSRESLFFPYDQYLPSDAVRLEMQRISKTDIDTMRAFAPDLLLSLYSKEIVPAALLSLPRLGAYNLHPALLPSYGGVSPTFWCLANNERQTGVTFHQMSPQIDEGAIAAQGVIAIEGFGTEHSLYLRCTELGSALISQALPKIRVGEKVLERPGQQVPKSYFSIPTVQAINQFRKNGFRFFRWSEFR